MPRFLPAVASVAISLAGILKAHATDWPMFAFDQDQTANNTQETIINATNVSNLTQAYKFYLQEIESSPLLVSQFPTNAGPVDLLLVTTRSGTLIAIDGSTGQTVWSQATTGDGIPVDTAPVLDPTRQFVYGYGADGRVHKYAVQDGTEQINAIWPAVASLKSEHATGALEIATAQNTHTYLYAVNTGYYRDGGDHEGHVTAIDTQSGQFNVFNASCSNISGHLGPSACPTHLNGIWGRSGAVYDRRTNRLFVVTGNGPFDFIGGGFDWGDSVLALNADATGAGSGLPVDSYTPTDYASLEFTDTDLGSNSVVLLPTPSNSNVHHLGAIIGKDTKLRLLNLDNLNGSGHAGGVAGELQATDPLGVNADIPTGHPAVWIDSHGDGATWIFVATPSSFQGVKLAIDSKGNPSLQVQWTSGGFSGASPIVADDVLYYPPIGAMDPKTGAVLKRFSLDNGCCFGSWPSMIVANGRVYVTGIALSMFQISDVIFQSGFETTPATDHAR